MEIYSPEEIARAVGVSKAEVSALLGVGRRLVPESEALRVGRAIIESRRAAASFEPAPLFSTGVVSGSGASRSPMRGIPLALSSSLHAALVVLALLITAGLTPTSATSTEADLEPEPLRLVFLATPGPGGGGGGGGLLQKQNPPKAMRQGRQALNSPLPERQPPRPIVAAAEPKDRNPEPLKAEQLPAVVAPLLTAPADNRSRAGVLAQTPADSDSHGAGRGGGAGTGGGTGLGDGEGPGVGPGSGGGTGGGPYRPGSGIEPPRLLREVKADYTEDARQRGVSGEVVLEIVVLRDGSVGDVKVLRGLAGGLNERAAQAVQQWRFSPARRLGMPVDVVVEVSVEFRLR